MEYHEAVVLSVVGRDEGSDFAPVGWVDVGAVDWRIERDSVNCDASSVQFGDVRGDLAEVNGYERTSTKVVYTADCTASVNN